MSHTFFCRILQLRVVLLAIFLLGGCSRHHVQSGRYDPVFRSGYAYLRQDDGAVSIVARTQQDLARALAEIGCGKKYICAVERVGEFFNVLQQEK